MAEVTSAAELKAAVGYGNGTSRVSGTNEGEDIDCIPSGTETWDLTAAEPLWSANGQQTINVRGGLTITGLLAATGTGNHDEPFRLTGDGVWDCNAYDNLDSSYVVPSTPGPSSIVIDRRPCVIDIATIANTGKTTSTASNLLTLVQLSSDTRLVQMVGPSAISNAGLDNISTKGRTGTPPTGALMIAYGTDSKTPGTGVSDQALTNHDGFDMLVFGGEYWGDLTQRKAIVNATNGGRLELVNTLVLGLLAEVSYFAGIDHNCAQLDGALVMRRVGTDNHGKQSRIYNPDVASTNDCMLDWFNTDETEGATLTQVAFEGGNSSGTTAIRRVTQTGQQAQLTLDRCYFDENIARALDLRNAGASFAGIVATDTIAQCPGLSWVVDDAADITGSGCISAAASSPSAVRTNIGVARSATAEEIAAIGAGRTVQSLPSYGALVTAIMSGNGSLLLANNTAESMTSRFGGGGTTCEILRSRRTIGS